MQVNDTFSAVGWNDPRYFNNYMEAKKGMKLVLDAAHARGIIFRTIPNSVLRLAQISEPILVQRKNAVIPAGANANAQKKFIRSQQRDATALMVRRMFKRMVTKDTVDANLIEPLQDQSLYDGVASKIAYRTLDEDDIRALSDLERGPVPAGRAGWLTHPYSKVLTQNITARSYNFNIGEVLNAAVPNNGPLYGLIHSLGISPNYLRNLVFPQGGVVRKDIEMIVAFGLDMRGRTYRPVGFSIYGTCQSEVSSTRIEGPQLPDDQFINQIYDNDCIQVLRRTIQDNQNYAAPGFPALVPEGDQAFRETIGQNGQYYNQADPAANRGNNEIVIVGAGRGDFLPYVPYNTGTKSISELQNKIYNGNVAEIYCVCASDIISLEYDAEKDQAIIDHGGAPGLPDVPDVPAKTMSGYGTLIMSFTMCMIASERENRVVGDVKRWFPKYAGIITELAPDNACMDHAEAAVRALPFPQMVSTLDGRADEREARDNAKLGTQKLRKICYRLGFTSQPVLKADSYNIVGKLKLPNFAESTIGPDDENKFPFVNKIQNDQAISHLGGEIDRTSFVALYKPCQTDDQQVDIEADYIPLEKLLASVPSILQAENSRNIDDDFKKICPDGRGKGSIMCM